VLTVALDAAHREQRLHVGEGKSHTRFIIGQSK
jgi:hypothetical protein